MKSLHDRRRFSALLRILAGTTLALLVWTLSTLIPGCPADDPECSGVKLLPTRFENDWLGDSRIDLVDVERDLTFEEEPEEEETERRLQSVVSVGSGNSPRPFGETTFQAHAPGFSVIENAYWRNDTWYLITSKPWSFPDLSLVVSNAPDHGERVFTDESVVRVMSLKEAKEAGLEVQGAEEEEGTSLIFNDRIYLDHFYHLTGEMFLGAWRMFTSTLDVNSASVLDKLPEITALVFAHVHSRTVFDHAGLNKFFLGRFFPNAKWEFQSEWQARAETGKFYRFQRIIIADRKCGHLGGGISKPMDRAFETPVPANWIRDLKDRVLETYGGPVSLEDPAHAREGVKPVVTYLSRQTAAHRRLTEETHAELVQALVGLAEEGIAEVHVEEFTDADPKDEQVAKLSRTTILVGLHGNGLTNLLWMTPDAHGRSTVFEIQQKGMFLDDYAVLSEALGIEHWIIGGRSDQEYCQRSTCGIRGVDDGIKGGSKDYTADVPELLRRIRGRLLLSDSDAVLDARSAAEDEVKEVKDASHLSSHVTTSHAIRHGLGHSRFHQRRISASRD